GDAPDLGGWPEPGDHGADYLGVAHEAGTLVGITATPATHAAVGGVRPIVPEQEQLALWHLDLRQTAHRRVGAGAVVRAGLPGEVRAQVVLVEAHSVDRDPALIVTAGDCLTAGGD